MANGGVVKTECVVVIIIRIIILITIMNASLTKLIIEM